MLGEPGRESTAGGREVPGGCKGCCFRDFAKGSKTLRKRLGFWGGAVDKYYICHGRYAAEYIMISNKLICGSQLRCLITIGNY